MKTLASGFAALLLPLCATLKAEVAAERLERLEQLIIQQQRQLKAQEERLNQLEAQNRQLRQELQNLPPAAEPDASAPPPQAVACAPAAQNVVSNSLAEELAARFAFVKPGGVSVVPYGYLKFDAVYDTARTAFGDASVYAIPRSQSGGNRRDLSFSAREARLGFAVDMPENTAFKVSGKLEGDFYGDLANQDSYQLRLRLAYFDIAWGSGWSLRLGQDWDTFTCFHPKMLDAGILAGAGHVWGRRPQVRLTKVTPLGAETRLILKTALENGYKNDVDSDGQQDSNASGIPQSVAMLGIESRLLGERDTHLSLAGLYGAERTRRDPNPDRYPVELVQLALYLPLARQLTLQGTLWSGRNLDAYYGGIMQGINLERGRSIVTRGGWMQTLYDFSERWSTALGYGFDNPSDSDLSLATARTFNERYFTSLFYKLRANLLLGCEYTVLRTSFKEEERVTDQRFQVSGQLFF